MTSFMAYLFVEVMWFDPLVSDQSQRYFAFCVLIRSQAKLDLRLKFETLVSAEDKVTQYTGWHRINQTVYFCRPSSVFLQRNT